MGGKFQVPDSQVLGFKARPLSKIVFPSALKAVELGNLGTWDLGTWNLPPSEQVPDDLALPLQIPISITTFPGEIPGKRQIPREPWASANSDVLEVPMAKIAIQRLRGPSPGSDSCECCSALHVRNLWSRLSTTLSLPWDTAEHLINGSDSQVPEGQVPVGY